VSGGNRRAGWPGEKKKLVNGKKIKEELWIVGEKNRHEARKENNIRNRKMTSRGKKRGVSRWYPLNNEVTKREGEHRLLRRARVGEGGRGAVQ